MAILSEPKRLSDVFLYELEQDFARVCREQAIILAGSGAARTLTRGMVLGKTTTGGAATATANAGNTGNGVLGTITVSGPAKIGTHRLRITAAAANAGTFVHEDPNGTVVDVGTVGVAYSGGGLAFTLADGATDFVVGDGFDIAVTGIEKFQQLNLAGTDGSQIAAGVLVTDTVTAPDGVDAKAVVAVRGPVVLKTGGLVWPAGATAGQKSAALAQLAALGMQNRQEA